MNFFEQTKREINEVNKVPCNYSTFLKFKDLQLNFLQKRSFPNQEKSGDLLLGLSYRNIFLGIAMS